MIIWIFIVKIHIESSFNDLRLVFLVYLLFDCLLTFFEFYWLTNLLIYLLFLVFLDCWRCLTYTIFNWLRFTMTVLRSKFCFLFHEHLLKSTMIDMLIMLNFTNFRNSCMMFLMFSNIRMNPYYKIVKKFVIDWIIVFQFGFLLIKTI